MKMFKIICISCIAAAGFLGCNIFSKSKNVSRGTGWNINSEAGGFKYNTGFKEQETAPGMVFIEGGTFTMGKVQDDVMHDWNNTPTQQHVQSFYMDETEVTNMMYLEYLDWLKKVFPPDNPNYKNIYTGALPDTLVWRNRLGNNEVMVNNYLRHPAYADYPVVGVSWVQAVQYSKWRTDRVNENILEREGYLKENAKYAALNKEVEGTFSTETYIQAPQQTYGGAIDSLQGTKLEESIQTDSTATNAYANRSSGVLLPEYRLPTEAEWEYAALGLIGIREYNNYRGKKKYPWKGEYTRSGKRKSKGDQLANFKQGKGDYGGIAGWSDDGADITAAVASYPPNDYGLYDMSGNVSEWVADVYRPLIDDIANDFNYYRGNVYMKTAIGENGKVSVVGENAIVYDTLSNGKIIARNLPGEVATIPIDENDTYLRPNFSSSDNINYRDGDLSSTRYYDYYNDEDEDNPNKRMYNAPKNNITTDSIGKLLKEVDKSSRRTSLVDDKVRVYKGGSWKDRAYWLDPAQRRYMPQYLASDHIGFRCAMSRVGSKARNKKKARGK